ncbi:Type II transport protein GspH [Mariprofundus aestuarium]|uniref:Type II secretion system protein H n=1 Tax=Mariprofundus aestuarium TaxID=1921086 RepID=A0A2K8KVT6_MARES|nr:Type II transport protein GspH [Mariprofundus aestuarium]
MEVLIVVVIIGVMSAIALPSFSSWREKQAVRGAAQTLLSHLKQARVLAIAENRSVSITFTSTSYTYDADLSGSCGACRSQVISYDEFSSNLSISPTTTRTFTSRGTSNSGTMTLTVGGTSRSITQNVIGRSYLQ